MSHDYNARFVFTRSFVLPLLSDEFANILSQKHPGLAQTIENGMLLSVDHMLRFTTASIDTHETTAAGLIDKLGEFFSAFYLTYLGDAVSQFDMLSGETEVSICDAFTAMETPRNWVLKITCAMASAAERAADVEIFPRPGGHSSIVPPAPSAAITTTTQQPGQHSSSTVKDPVAAPSSPSCPIIDVNLVGPNIKAAWAANALTREMEEEAVAPVRRNANWTPEGTSLPVYHGTTAPELNTEREYAHMDMSARLTLSNVIPTVLHPTMTFNQMVPSYYPLANIYTAYSPLRCYLWSLFHSEVITNIPTQTAILGNMASRWQCPHPPQHHHRGVRLLKFCPNSSAMSALSPFILRNGDQDNWIRRVEEVRNPYPVDTLSDNDGPTDRLWALFQDFHGQPAGTQWPSILHCHEGELQGRMLRPFTKQLWRTVWHRRDCRVLNSSLHSNMAINLTITNPVETDTDPTDSGHERQGRHQSF